MRALILFAALLVAPASRAADDEYAYARVDASTQPRRYELERAIYRDDEQTYALKAVAVLTSDGLLRFESMTKYADNIPFDMTGEAVKFAGFAVPVSSDPVVPELKDADPTVAGLVTDLRAVYLALGAPSGIGRLRRVGDSYARPEPVSLSRAGRASAPVSEDCLAAKLVLTGLTPAKALLRAAFTPPAKACRAPLAPWMEKAVDPEGLPNNVWQVTRTGGTVRVQWGSENATVEAALDRKTGALLSADLIGVRFVSERTRCDERLAGCSVSTDSVARRTLKVRAR